MTTAPRLRFSFQDYLTVDAGSAIKHEFLDGMILAMADCAECHRGTNGLGIPETLLGFSE